MTQILKFSYPTGKIFISVGKGSDGDDHSGFDWRGFQNDLAKLPMHEQLDYSIRRQVLWEQHDCSSELLIQKHKEFVKRYQANNPTIGYNLSPAQNSSNNHEGWRVGVDGCKGGWFYVASDGSETRYGIVSTVAELFKEFDNVTGAFIDIPIGLFDSGAQARDCDKMARQALKPRGSTVFPAPVRPCLKATTYEEACRISESLTGKKLSQQAFHIFSKIREVDELLQQQPRLKKIICEVHPELGFCMLNSGIPLLTQKKTAEGIEERLYLLGQHNDKVRDIYEAALAKYPRKLLSRDDIVDAMMCLCIAQASPEDRRMLPEPVCKDDHGIEMAMHYFMPSI